MEAGISRYRFAHIAAPVRGDKSPDQIAIDTMGTAMVIGICQVTRIIRVGVCGVIPPTAQIADGFVHGIIAARSVARRFALELQLVRHIRFQPGCRKRAGKLPNRRHLVGKLR